MQITLNATSENKSTAKMTFETKEEEKPVIESQESDEEKEKEETPSTPTGAIPTDIQEIMDDTDQEIKELANSPMIKITSAISSAVMKIWSFFSGLFGG